MKCTSTWESCLYMETIRASDKKNKSSLLLLSSALYDSESSEEVKNRGINSVSIKHALLCTDPDLNRQFISCSCPSAVAASVYDDLKTFYEERFHVDPDEPK